MKLSCHQPHFMGLRNAYEPWYVYNQQHNLRIFIMCYMLHKWPRVKPFMLKLGIWDADTDGRIMYWRWDFWNGNIRKAIKRLDR